jgi:hypothetical protein
MEGKFNVIKYPMFEEDSSFFSVDKCFVEKLRALLKNDKYFQLKRQKFLRKDVSKTGFEEFSKDRPSLKNMSSFLEGTVYTFSCEKKNGKSYENVIQTVKNMLEKNSRRAFLTMSDRLLDYEYSVDGDVDVSCLSAIHYKQNSATIMFRASDIENELLVDILTVYDFFISPVYEDKNINVDLMISSCQNIKSLEIIVNI